MNEFDHNRTLQELEAADWGEPHFGSLVVTNVHRLRRIPLKDFSIEDLRLMVAQQQSLLYLVPLALKQLSSDPLSSTLSIYAAKASVSIRRSSKALGILTISCSSHDIQKPSAGHRCWRTKAIVSAKVGTSLAYQAA